MSRWSDQRQVQDTCPHSRAKSTKTHAVAHNLPQLHFCLLKELPSISINLPRSSLTTTVKKAVKNNSKWSSTLPCGRTVTSRWQFGGQHGVLHDIGGSEKGALLWTTARTIIDSQLNNRHPPRMVASAAKEPHFCNRAYSITNVRLNWRVHQAGVGWCGAHMTTAHSCCILRHSTPDWLCSAHIKMRMFSTYCTNHGQEFPLRCAVL
jgi:hypothetical protein